MKKNEVDSKINKIDENSLKWFESYLVKRSRSCSVNGYISGTIQITCGVPQVNLTSVALFEIH